MCTDTLIALGQQQSSETGSSAAVDVPGSADSRHAEAKAINKSDATMSASSLLERDQSGSAAALVLDGFNMWQTLLEPCPCDGSSTVSTTALDSSSNDLSNASERKIVTEQGCNKARSVKRVGPCLRCRTYGEPVC